MKSEKHHSGNRMELPEWFTEYKKALSQIDGADFSGSWNQSYDTLFGELEWSDDDVNSIVEQRKIEFDSFNEKQKKAYEQILECKCAGINLDTPIYHYTTFSYLNEAIKMGGFLLSQPKDWSINWEDTIFKNLQKSAKSTEAEELVNAYLKYSFGMCWTLNGDNENILEMERRKHPGESVVIIESTVRKLLSAYITDNISIRACSVVRMKYLPGKDLRGGKVSSDDLMFGDAGTDVHHESISKTIDKYQSQDEVRLIFEDYQECCDKTLITIVNKMYGREEIKLIKHIDLRMVITSIRVAENDYLFKC